MKIAIGYSTRDRIEFTRRTLPPLLESGVDVFWVDGSVTDAGRALPFKGGGYPVKVIYTDVYGGSDVAIIYAMTMMLESSENYDYIGLLENDVLLEPGWLPRLLGLFETPSVPVGAVSARTISDRVLFPLGDRAVMGNLGGGMILFHREAAMLALANHRTWPNRDVRHVFLTMAGVDVMAPGGMMHYGGGLDDTMCYGSADWTWDVVLALHGWATMAPMPTMARNIDEIGGSLLYVGEASVDESRHIAPYLRALARAGESPPASLGVIFTVTTRVWLVVSQHVPRAAWNGAWTCRHETLRGFGGHVFMSVAAGDMLTLDWVGTECTLFIAAPGGAVAEVDVDGSVDKFDVPADMNRLTVKRTYGAHRVALLAHGPGVEVFGAAFAERQTWFVPERPFSFHSLPTISAESHRDRDLGSGDACLGNTG